jgi:DNA-binding Lrp family transcriptional regulator
VVRIHAKPDDLPRLADTLVRRPEVAHANVLSGWTELVCFIRAPLGLALTGCCSASPARRRFSAFDIDLVLHTFGEPATAHRTAYGHKLTVAQANRIPDGAEEVSASGRPISPTDEDGVLFDALGDDGRAALEASGTLTYDVDLLPSLLGFEVNAMLWLTVAPRHLHGVGEQIASHDEIASVAATSGRNNLMAIVICRDVDHLYRYLAERLAAIEDVESYDVRIRTQRLKQTASVIARTTGSRHARATGVAWRRRHPVGRENGCTDAMPVVEHKQTNALPRARPDRFRRGHGWIPVRDH